MINFDFFLPTCLVDSEQRVGGGACGKQTHQSNPETSSETAIKISELCYFTFFVKNIKTVIKIY